MRRFVVLAGVCAVAALTGGAATARASAAAGGSSRSTPSTEATVNVSPAQVKDGDTVFVSGNDWPAATQVAVQVCGAAGRGGSSHCDLPSSTIVGTSATGSFGTQLLVHEPPVPCPCVVKVDAVGTAATRSVPLQLAGAPVAPVPAVAKVKASPPLRVESARVERGSWAGWFGVPVTRTLVLRVHNVSGAPVNQPLLLVSAGRPSNPDGTQTVPPIGPFAIDQTRTIRVPVELGALAIGNYGVRVRTGAQGSMASATTTAPVWPWGLFAIALVLVQLLLLALRNAARRRLARREAAATASMAAPATPSEPVVVRRLPTVPMPVRVPTRVPRPTSAPDSGLEPVSWMPPLTWRPPAPVDEPVLEPASR